MELIENLTKALGIPRWGTAPLDRCGPYLPCRGAELLNQRHRTVICFLFPYFTGEMPGRNLSYIFTFQGIAPESVCALLEASAFA